MSHKIQMYENLRDMLEREVKDIEKKGDLTEQSLDNLYKLTAALKVVDKCIDREEGGQGGNSNNYGGNSYANRRYPSDSDNTYGKISYGMNSTMWPTELELQKMSPNQKIREGMKHEGIYDNSMGRYSMDYTIDGYSRDGNSYARRGRDGDSDGRYNESHDNFRDNTSRDGYSTDGYSRDASRKKMVQKLETLMDDTMSEHERKAIQDCINKIK